jgi:NitT/TauT family transport system permease protein
MTDAPPANLGPRRRAVPLSWITTPLLTLAFIAVWQAYVSVTGINKFILPAPLAVWEALQDMLQARSTLWGHLQATVYQTLAGFAIALVLGIGLGAVLAKIPTLERTLNPFIVATQVVPKVALVPLFVVWFGFGPTSKVVTAAILAFFPIFTNTLLGVKSVDLGHRDVMTALNVSRWQNFTMLEFPSALPYILTGMEVGIVLAIIGSVVGEYLGGNRGLGYLLIAKMNAFETDALFAVIIIMTVVGFLFYLGVRALRRIVIPWHESVLIEQRAN